MIMPDSREPNEEQVSFRISKPVLIIWLLAFYIGALAVAVNVLIAFGGPGYPP